MPHQCTNCGRTFADGSKEMLSGCPECSGTKFQFHPDGFDDASGLSRTNPDASETSPAGDPTDAVSRTVGSAAATVRDLVAGSAGPDATTATPRDGTDADDGDDIIVAESEPLDESDAQADARSQVVAPDEVPESPGDGRATGDADSPTVASDSRTADTTGTGGSAGDAGSEAETPTDGSAGGRSVATEPDTERTERPDLAQLREELNDQFESIRVVEPGQYELNLMELYDREEYVIALQEDGRYSIQVPETWRDADGY